MTLTPPPFTLTHGRQVKDNHIFLQKLSAWTFYGAIPATDIMHHFSKHIQKAYLQVSLGFKQIYF
jgi:hypothetical protein